MKDWVLSKIFRPEPLDYFNEEVRKNVQFIVLRKFA